MKNCYVEAILSLIKTFIFLSVLNGLNIEIQKMFGIYNKIYNIIPFIFTWSMFFAN